MKCKICENKLSLYKDDLFDDRYGYPGKFKILVCNKCGFGQLDPQLDDSELSDLYTNYYPRQSITAESIKNSVKFKEGMFASISRWFNGSDIICYRYPESGKALDVGCGNAVSLLEMEKKGIEAFGIEEDRNVDGPAKELGLRVEIGNIYNSKYPKDYFDYVTLNQVLEHIPDPIRFLLAVREKLKKDGLLIASFPNFDSLYRKICGRKWIHWHVPYHLNHFSRKSIEILANDSGFKVKRHKIITPTTWSILQVENIIFRQKEGESHEQWGVKNKEDMSFDKKVIRKILFAGMFFLRVIFSILNKFLDYFRQGDGIVVFLEKK